MNKRDALLSEVTTTLEAHRADIRSEKHFPALSELQASRAARLDKMGDDTDTIWYCYVFPIDVAVLGQQSDGTGSEMVQDFEVGVYYEWQPSDDYSGSSQERWDKMMFNTPSDSPIGLFEHLVELSVISTGSGSKERTVVNPPESVREGTDIFGIRQMDSQGKEWAHEAQMRVGLEDFMPR